MEISPGGEKPDVADLLKEALTALETQVDKSPAPQELVLRSNEEYVEAWDKLKADKRGLSKVIATLKPFSTLAFRIHRLITGKTAEYSKYYEDRLKVYDAAIIEYDDRKERERIETEKRLQEQAREEDSQRRLEEAAALEKRATAEGREDLKQRAEELITAPAREVSVSVEKSVPKIGGGSIRKRFVATCEDEDALVPAIGRRAAFLEAAALIGSQKGGKKFADLLKERAHAMPEIPVSVVKVQDTKITQIANGCNGKLDWPGVSVKEDKKTSARGN